MLKWHRIWTAVLCVSLLSPWSLLPGNAYKVPKQDRSWKQYRNKSRGYCVSYPSRWVKGDAYEGAGLFVKTGRTKHSASPVGEIDISMLEPPPSVKPVSTALTLNDNVQFHLDGVIKFQRAQGMRLVETHRMTLADNPALFMKDQYFDPLERSSWTEDVIFVNRGDQLYRLELVCLAKDAERFERVFQQVVNSFSFDCSSTR